MNNKNSKEVKVTLQIRISFIAFHYWKKAPKEVAFLRNPHRHIFSVVAMIPVSGYDRELEFFLLQKDVKNFVDKNYNEKTFPKSCEQIALEIKDYLDKKYKRDTHIGVYEDNENGAIVQ
jgi:hypothetical protein